MRQRVLILTKRHNKTKGQSKKKEKKDKQKFVLYTLQFPLTEGNPKKKFNQQKTMKHNPIVSLQS